MITALLSGLPFLAIGGIIEVDHVPQGRGNAVYITQDTLPMKWGVVVRRRSHSNTAFATAQAELYRRKGGLTRSLAPDSHIDFFAAPNSWVDEGDLVVTLNVDDAELARTQALIAMLLNIDPPTIFATSRELSTSTTEGNATRFGGELGAKRWQVFCWP